MTQCLFILQRFMDPTLFKTTLLLSRHSCTEALGPHGFSQSPTPALRPDTWETATNSSNSTNDKIKRQNKETK